MALNRDREGSLVPIEILYWGRKYVYSLPWHNGWVLLAITLPPGVLLLVICGVFAALKEWWRSRPGGQAALFLLLHAVTLPVLRMLSMPAHDGVRLMLPSLLFVAALAGMGFAAIADWVAGRWPLRAKPIIAALGCMALLPGLVSTYRSHPLELSYYNVLVGGLPGAQRHGFEVTYWYDAVNREALAKIDAGLPSGSFLLHHQHVDVFSEWQSQLQNVTTGEAGPLEKTYFGLLTHGSKSNPTTRLLFGMRPMLVPVERDGVRLYSIYSTQAFARASALTLLTHAASEEREGAGPALSPSEYSQEVLAIARRNADALRAVASALSGDERQGEPSLAGHALDVVVGPNGERMQYFKETMAPYLAIYPRAWHDAVEILIAHPGRVESLIRTPGYPPDGAEGYLDGVLPESP